MRLNTTAGSKLCYVRLTAAAFLLLFCPQGGESQALVRLGDYLADAKWVCAFEKPKTDPSAFVRPATTVLSPYLKFGCLSPRLFHARLMAVYRGAKGVHSKPPVSLRGQLLWREFFYTVRAAQCMLLGLLVSEPAVYRLFMFLRHVHVCNWFFNPAQAACKLALFAQRCIACWQCCYPTCAPSSSCRVAAP